MHVTKESRKKTEIENPAAMGAQSPCATTIEIIAIRERISPAKHADEDDQHPTARLHAEPSSPELRSCCERR